MASDEFTNPDPLPPARAGWRSVAIEDLCLVTSGGTPLRSNRTFYDGGTHAWFKTGELRDRTLIDSVEKITDAALEHSSAKLFPAGTVLMAMYGDGDTITSLGILAKQAATNQACCAMIPDWNLCDSRFLFYALRHHRRDFLRLASGGAQRNLSGRLIRRFGINAPPIQEQRAIAHILGTLDDKIELNRRMNETLEAMARALFKSWFVDFDPVRAKAEGRPPPGMDAETAQLFPSEMEDPELGEVPRSWIVAPLDDIADFRNGLALQRFRPNDGEARLPVVKIAQLRTGDADSGEWSRADIDPACVLDDGDIVFSWSGSLTVIVWCGGRAALNQHLFRVTSGEYPKWFLLGWLLRHLPEFQRIAGAKATTMGHIQRHHLSAARCVIPPQVLLERVSARFAALLGRRVQLQLESRSLRDLRDALLPRLLSGELSVGQGERLAEAARS